MTISPELDERFRAAAAAEGLLDVAYDVTDSPVGPLLVAVSERGLCRISFDAEPERQIESLARSFGARVLRSRRPLDDVKRELHEYFSGERRAFDLPVDIERLTPFNRSVLEELARVPYGSLTTYGTLAGRARRPRGGGAGGTDMNGARRGNDHEPEPDPDRPPVPSRRRLDGQPRRLRRGPRTQGNAAGAGGRAP